MAKKIGFRTWILIIVLLLSLLLIAPSFEKGVIIKSVDKNSQAYELGLRQNDIIKSINNKPINNLSDYSEVLLGMDFLNNYTKIDIKTKDKEVILFTNSSLDITVANVPKSKIKLGLDLQGGSRALIKPVDVKLSQSELADLISVTNERFNVYGISDISVKPVSDLEGNNYMLIEIAGASPTELQELVGKQGKFEAKIGNETIFIGGKKDILQVCRNDAQCSGVTSCLPSSGGYACRFQFSVTLSEEAAQRHADITSKIPTNVTEGGERYLDKKLDLYVDEKLVDSLLISENLKGKVTTQISVSGSGSGKNREEAISDSRKSMNKLQTIMITGSLPYKLQIEKIDTISPALSSQFIKYVILAAFLSLIVVALMILIRYRKIKISLTIILVNIAEIIITLGFAAFIKWNLDIASIAGLLIMLGTGVDQEIIMTDEAVTRKDLSMVQKIKRALFIIFGSYFTVLASLLPLYWVGAGMFKGFAFTTIIGLTIGVFISRPAFAEILSKLENK